MVHNGAGANKISWQVYQIQISDMHRQANVCFGLLDIGNVGNMALPNPLVLLALKISVISSHEVKKSTTGCNQRVQRKKHLSINLGFIEGNMNGLTLGV